MESVINKPIPDTAPPEVARFLNKNLEGAHNYLVNLTRLNDIRYINKFLESANQQLPLEGRFAGCVEVSQRRKERILKKYPKPFNKLYYGADFLVKRVWPKLPYLRGSYFALTQGRNRVVSEMETYGRLYSCGFRLVDTIEHEEKLYFIAEKTGEPAYNTEATYGPLINLRRVGQHGKLFKVYKMRTMSPYSEYIQQFIYERNGYDGGDNFKDDTRITTLGQFMRKYWIDELPMIWNLVRGDLKIFGVRPVSAHYLSLFPEEFQEYRKKFKPGLIPPVYVEVPNTFDEIWQIEQRYLEAYEQAPLKTDLHYLGKAFYNIFIKRVRSS
ncbi:MAG: sugar transferase [Saprospirales bacterium]|nr:sugar transferase [Saprospirales bacterium]